MRKKGSKSTGRKGSGVDLTEGKWSNERHFVETTSKQGFMCQVHVKTALKITPEQLFGIFSSPDNSHIFRDLGKTVKYKVMYDDPDVAVECIAGKKLSLGYRICVCVCAGGL